MATQQKEPTKYYVDRDGNYAGGFADITPADLIEVPAAPANALDRWDGAKWIPYDPPYAEKREALYAQIGIPDQLDALYKLALKVMPLVGLTPDLNKPVDTPEGLVARISAIKAENPKP